MKTFPKSLLLALLLISAFGALLILTAQHAQARTIDDHTIKSAKIVLVNTADAAVLKLLVDAPDAKPITLELRNREGTVIWEHRVDVKQTSFRFRLNLTEVPDGHYTVIVRGRKARTAYSITLATAQLTEAARSVTIDQPAS